MAFVRSDVPSRRRKDLEPGKVEGIGIELQLGDRKWLLIAC